MLRLVLIEATARRNMGHKSMVAAKAQRVYHKRKRSEQNKGSSSYKRDTNAPSEWRIFDVTSKTPYEGERAVTCSKCCETAPSHVQQHTASSAKTPK